MGFNSLFFISLFLPQFLVVYYYNKKNIKNTGTNKGSYNTANAIQGLIFALFTTLISPFILSAEYTLGGGNTLATDIMMHIALSFFACHVFFIVLAKNVTSEITHHLVCISALLYSLTMQTFGQDLLLTIFLGEVTFTHYGKIIAKNMHWNKLEIQLNEVFFCSFSIIRLFVFPIYLYNFMIYSEAALFLKFFATAFVLLGIYYNLIIAKNRMQSRPLKILTN